MNKPEISTQQWYDEIGNHLLLTYTQLIQALAAEFPEARTYTDAVKNALNGTLLTLAPEYGFAEYLVICDDTNNTPAAIGDGKYLATYVWIRNDERNVYYEFPFRYVSAIVKDGTVVREAKIEQDFIL